MSTIKTDTLSNQTGSKTVPVDTVVAGSAKAWVNFNGTGTVAIRASFNVSSITDNGVGDYTVNFTTAMADADYSVLITSGYPSASAGRGPLVDTMASNSFRFLNRSTSGVVVDDPINSVSINGN